MRRARPTAPGKKPLTIRCGKTKSQDSSGSEGGRSLALSLHFVPHVRKPIVRPNLSTFVERLRFTGSQGQRNPRLQPRLSHLGGDTAKSVAALQDEAVAIVIREGGRRPASGAAGFADRRNQAVGRVAVAEEQDEALVGLFMPDGRHPAGVVVGVQRPRAARHPPEIGGCPALSPHYPPRIIRFSSSYLYHWPAGADGPALGASGLHRRLPAAS